MSAPDREAVASRGQPGLRFWLAWVLANSIGGALGGAAIEVAGALGAGVFGIALGIPQWLVLRRYLPRTGWWMGATALGAAIFWGMVPFITYFAFVLAFLVLSLFSSPEVRTALDAVFYPVMAAIGGAAAGLIVGLLQQWLVLERHLRHAGWWAVSSIAGGAMAAGIAGLDLYARTTTRTFELLAAIRGGGDIPSASGALLWAPHGSVSGAVFGTAYALITGVALVWLLRHRTVIPGRTAS